MNEIEKLLARYGGQIFPALRNRNQDAWNYATNYLPDEAKDSARRMSVRVVERGGDEGPSDEDGEQGYEGEAWIVIEASGAQSKSKLHYMIFSSINSYGEPSYIGFCQVEGVQETVTRFKPK